MHQKLFTIYLTEDVDEDRTLQDHLAEYLDTGWRIVSITPLGQGSRPALPSNPVWQA